MNGRPKLYVEAKNFKADINKEEYANQAIRYAWNKGVNWAVLTDFEVIKVFYSQSISSHLSDKQFFSISCTEFLERFDRLWLLSRESLGSGLIDMEAKDSGKMLEKVSVTDLLYKDLNRSRELLTKGFKLWNESVSRHLLDEGVQKLINRLVFIRVLEDRNIEGPILKPLLHTWRSRKVEKNREPFYCELVGKFRELDQTYNSNLFSSHPFEEWDDIDNATEDVIEILYGKQGYYEYDFRAIPADILGAVYENYLGYQLAQSKKDSAGLKEKGKAKRKEEGIYYTPTFIVDYIINNTLVPVLTKCHSFDDIMKIKVLDPACGSGSFLIKAMDAIYHRYYELGYRNSPTYKKIQIITENIYGVDLDEQAVEIARLNVLINAIEEKILLPSLAKNIENGNSLISGTDEELKKYFGLDWKNKKAFNWQEKFPEVFRQGGFDVIIGNPPYSSKQSLQTKQIVKLFSTVEYKADLYAFFIERGYQLLKPKGLLGFIIPATWMTNYYYRKIRELLIKSQSLNKIVMLDGAVFKNANVDTSLLFLEKCGIDSRKFTWSRATLENLNISATSRSYNSVESEERYDIVPNDSEDWQRIKIKIDLESKKLNLLGKISLGMKLSSNKEFISNVQGAQYPDPIYFGDDIARYGYLIPSRFFNFSKAKIVGGTKKIEIHKAKPKILIQSIRNLSLKRRIVSSLETKGHCFIGTINAFVLNDSHYDIRYILGLLNSTLLNSYFSKRFTTISLTGAFLGILPIRIVDNSNIKYCKEIIDLVDKMLKLQKESHGVNENSNEWEKIKDEITKTDHKIDDVVYKLYGLTDGEIKIIESD